MRTQGVKVLDGELETRHVQWMVVSRSECPDQSAEQRVVNRYFCLPHEAWSTPPAFAEAVTIRRSRTRVLFSQRVGIAV